MRNAVNSSTIGYYFNTLWLDDWTNVTITESQVSDLTHTTDTFNSTNDMINAVNLTGITIIYDTDQNITTNTTCLELNGPSAVLRVC